MSIIRSKKNQHVMLINKLKHKKYRESENKYFIEGKKVVFEAMTYGAKYIKQIYVSEDYAKKNRIDGSYIIFSNDVYEYISEDKNPEGILAIMEKTEVKEIKYDKDIILVLAAIRDPGNLGNMLRTADALNLEQVIISEDTVDPFMPKVIRSSMGAIFRLNIVKADLNEKIPKLKKENYKVYVADMQGEDIYSKEAERSAIILGNESQGAKPEVLELADGVLSIPMVGKTESLNVATSGALILYEMYRKRTRENNKQNNKKE